MRWLAERGLVKRQTKDWIKRRCVSLDPSRRTLTSNGRRLVLGIESSCDDSCAALVSAPVGYPSPSTIGSADIHASVVRKQDHGATKGIHPLHATHGHSSNLPIAITEALQIGQAKGVVQDSMKPSEIDAIAVTQGPGMPSCLAQGLSMAKMLSALWVKPLLYVHHMVAHTLTPLLTAKADDGTSAKNATLELPFLVLLLSGGHTQFVLCRSLSQFKILAATNDNSIGDAFDKVARELGITLEWSKRAPGAALELFARRHPDHSQENRYKLTVPRCKDESHFSYSGYISAVNRMVKENSELIEDEVGRRALAFAFQRDAFAQLQDKLNLVFQDGILLPEGIKPNRIRDVVVSGGVASNETLRRALSATLAVLDRSDIRLHFPPVPLCTDNAAMIAHAGLIHWRPTSDLTANPRARWSLEEFQ